MTARRLPPLLSLRAFEAAARHGSFKAAGEELSVTPTAISHQIRSLEDRLGVSLFRRRPRQVVLTREGEVLFPPLRDGFDAFAAALSRVGLASRRPVVTITATRAFTARWLLPRVARFQLECPDIDLQFHASDEIVDLSHHAIDLAIRYGRGPWAGLAAEPLMADRFAPVVNSALGVREPADLREVPLIHFDWQRPDPLNPTWEAWARAAGLSHLGGSAQLRFTDESHAIQAAVAGQGAAMLSLVLVHEEIAQGRVTIPFGPCLEGPTWHLVTRADIGPAASLVLEWLRREARAGGEADSLPGPVAARP